MDSEYDTEQPWAGSRPPSGLGGRIAPPPNAATYSTQATGQYGHTDQSQSQTQPVPPSMSGHGEAAQYYASFPTTSTTAQHAQPIPTPAPTQATASPSSHPISPSHRPPSNPPQPHIRPDVRTANSTLRDKLFDLLNTPEDARMMEEYTEYIGVCKNCFDPSIARITSGPRRHHHHHRPRVSSPDAAKPLRQRLSDEALRGWFVEERTRVLKDDRYRKKPGKSDVTAAGLMPALVRRSSGSSSSSSASSSGSEHRGRPSGLRRSRNDNNNRGKGKSRVEVKSESKSRTVRRKQSKSFLTYDGASSDSSLSSGLAFGDLPPPPKRAKKRPRIRVRKPSVLGLAGLLAGLSTTVSALSAASTTGARLRDLSSQTDSGVDEEQKGEKSESEADSESSLSSGLAFDGGGPSIATTVTTRWWSWSSKPLSHDVSPARNPQDHRASKIEMRSNDGLDEHDDATLPPMTYIEPRPASDTSSTANVQPMVHVTPHATASDSSGLPTNHTAAPTDQHSSSPIREVYSLPKSESGALECEVPGTATPTRRKSVHWAATPEIFEIAARTSFDDPAGHEEIEDDEACGLKNPPLSRESVSGGTADEVTVERIENADIDVSGAAKSAHGTRASLADHSLFTRRDVADSAGAVVMPSRNASAEEVDDEEVFAALTPSKIEDDVAKSFLKLQFRDDQRPDAAFEERAKDPDDGEVGDRNEAGREDAGATRDFAVVSGVGCDSMPHLDDTPMVLQVAPTIELPSPLPEFIPSAASVSRPASSDFGLGTAHEPVATVESVAASIPEHPTVTEIEQTATASTPTGFETPLQPPTDLDIGLASSEEDTLLWLADLRSSPHNNGRSAHPGFEHTDKDLSDVGFSPTRSQDSIGADAVSPRVSVASASEWPFQSDRRDSRGCGKSPQSGPISQGDGIVADDLENILRTEEGTAGDATESNIRGDSWPEKEVQEPIVSAIEEDLRSDVLAHDSDVDDSLEDAADHASLEEILHGPGHDDGISPDARPTLEDLLYGDSVKGDEAAQYSFPSEGLQGETGSGFDFNHFEESIISRPSGGGFVEGEIDDDEALAVDPSDRQTPPYEVTVPEGRRSPALAEDVDEDEDEEEELSGEEREPGLAARRAAWLAEVMLGGVLSGDARSPHGGDFDDGVEGFEEEGKIVELKSDDEGETEVLDSGLVEGVSNDQASSHAVGSNDGKATDEEALGSDVARFLTTAQLSPRSTKDSEDDTDDTFHAHDRASTVPPTTEAELERLPTKSPTQNASEAAGQVVQTHSQDSEADQLFTSPSSSARDRSVAIDTDDASEPGLPRPLDADFAMFDDTCVHDDVGPSKATLDAACDVDQHDALQSLHCVTEQFEGPASIAAHGNMWEHGTFDQPVANAGDWTVERESPEADEPSIHIEDVSLQQEVGSGSHSDNAVENMPQTRTLTPETSPPPPLTKKERPKLKKQAEQLRKATDGLYGSDGTNLKDLGALDNSTGVLRSSSEPGIEPPGSLAADQWRVQKETLGGASGDVPLDAPPQADKNCRSWSFPASVSSWKKDKKRKSAEKLTSRSPESLEEDETYCPKDDFATTTGHSTETQGSNRIDNAFLASRAEEAAAQPESSSTSTDDQPPNTDVQRVTPPEDLVEDDLASHILNPATKSVNELHPASPAPSPLLSARPARTSSAQRTSESPPAQSRPSSSTAVPLNFTFGHSPVSSPARSTRALSIGDGAYGTTPRASATRTRQSRPNSSEFRPLYLVEKTSVLQDVAGNLPPLPPSETSSHISSLDDSDEFQSALESQPQTPPERNMAGGLSVDTSLSQATSWSDERRSQGGFHSEQSTPRASTFNRPEDVAAQRERAASLRSHFWTWDDLARLEGHSDGSAAGHVGACVETAESINDVVNVSEDTLELGPSLSPWPESEDAVAIFDDRSPSERAATNPGEDTVSIDDKQISMQNESALGSNHSSNSQAASLALRDTDEAGDVREVVPGDPSYDLDDSRLAEECSVAHKPPTDPSQSSHAENMEVSEASRATAYTPNTEMNNIETTNPGRTGEAKEPVLASATFENPSPDTEAPMPIANHGLALGIVTNDSMPGTELDEPAGADVVEHTSDESPQRSSPVLTPTIMRPEGSVAAAQADCGIVEPNLGTEPHGIIAPVEIAASMSDHAPSPKHERLEERQSFADIVPSKTPSVPPSPSSKLVVVDASNANEVASSPIIEDIVVRSDSGDSRGQQRKQSVDDGVDDLEQGTDRNAVTDQAHDTSTPPSGPEDEGDLWALPAQGKKKGKKGKKRKQARRGEDDVVQAQDEVDLSSKGPHPSEAADEGMDHRPAVTGQASGLAGSTDEAKHGVGGSAVLERAGDLAALSEEAPSTMPEPTELYADHHELAEMASSAALGSSFDESHPQTDAPSHISLGQPKSEDAPAVASTISLREEANDLDHLVAIEQPSIEGIGSDPPPSIAVESRIRSARGAQVDRPVASDPQAAAAIPSLTPVKLAEQTHVTFQPEEPDPEAFWAIPAKNKKKAKKGKKSKATLPNPNPPLPLAVPLVLEQPVHDHRDGVMHQHQPDLELARVGELYTAKEQSIPAPSDHGPQLGSTVVEPADSSSVVPVFDKGNAVSVDPNVNAGPSAQNRELDMLEGEHSMQSIEDDVEASIVFMVRKREHDWRRGKDQDNHADVTYNQDDDEHAGSDVTDELALRIPVPVPMLAHDKIPELRSAQSVNAPEQALQDDSALSRSQEEDSLYETAVLHESSVAGDAEPGPSSELPKSQAGHGHAALSEQSLDKPASTKDEAPPIDIAGSDDAAESTEFANQTAEEYPQSNRTSNSSSPVSQAIEPPSAANDDLDTVLSTSLAAAGFSPTLGSVQEVGGHNVPWQGSGSASTALSNLSSHADLQKDAQYSEAAASPSPPSPSSTRQSKTSHEDMDEVLAVSLAAAGLSGPVPLVRKHLNGDQSTRAENKQMEPEVESRDWQIAGDRDKDIDDMDRLYAQRKQRKKALKRKLRLASTAPMPSDIGTAAPSPTSEESRYKPPVVESVAGSDTTVVKPNAPEHTHIIAGENVERHLDTAQPLPQPTANMERCEPKPLSSPTYPLQAHEAEPLRQLALGEEESTLPHATSEAVNTMTFSENPVERFAAASKERTSHLFVAPPVLRKDSSSKPQNLAGNVDVYSSHGGQSHDGGELASPPVLNESLASHRSAGSKGSRASSGLPSLKRTSPSPNLRAASLTFNQQLHDRTLPHSSPSPQQRSLPFFHPPPTPPLMPSVSHAGDIDEPGRESPYYNDEGLPMAGDSAVSRSQLSDSQQERSNYLLDMEWHLDQLVEENEALKESSRLHGTDHGHRVESAMQEQERQGLDAEVQRRGQEIGHLRAIVEPLQHELHRLRESHSRLIEDTNGRYAALQNETKQANEQLHIAVTEVHSLRVQQADQHPSSDQAAALLAEKNIEIRELQEELDMARERIGALEARPLTNDVGDLDYLPVRDEDYFDNQCQELFRQIERWVLRFSKLSDRTQCRMTYDIDDDSLRARLDNLMLDGSLVDALLAHRVRRRDVFVALISSMLYEYVFTRYLFGLNRDQRQRLKLLEKQLSEVGPPRAVAVWRATTLHLLCQRESYIHQRDLDTLAVAHEVLAALCELLPPPDIEVKERLLASLTAIVARAAELSTSLRVQRAQFIMLPPLVPEKDAETGELLRTVLFKANLMNERSSRRSGSGSADAEDEDQVALDNERFEAEQRVLQLVLFPLVIKKGDDSGEGEEETVVLPAQVLVAWPEREVSLSVEKRPLGHDEALLSPIGLKSPASEGSSAQWSRLTS